MEFYRTLYALLNWEYEGEKERKIIEEQRQRKYFLLEQIKTTNKNKEIKKILTKNKRNKPIKLSDFLKSPIKN